MSAACALGASIEKPTPRTPVSGVMPANEGVGRVVSRWKPYGGLVYFHLLLDSLSKAGLVA